MSEYTDRDIVVNKAYMSLAGEYLIALSIDPKFQHVPDVSMEDWPSDWFYLDNSKLVHSLGGGMRLIDAGDYDDDGMSEVLFWETGYNKGGYILFHDHFLEKEEFSWGYH